MREVDRQAIIRVRRELQPLFEPKPWIHWGDFLLSATVGWGAFASSLRVESTWLTALCVLVSVFALYRALAFTHELEHQPLGSLPGLRPVWHVLVGMPFGLPHFVYRGFHRIHHSTRYYGTAEDPEYLPFVARGSVVQPIAFIFLACVFPVLVTARYLLLAPLSLLSRRLRNWVLTRISGFAMRPDYVRKPPVGAEMTALRIEEATTSVFVWGVIALTFVGELPILVLLHWYFVLVGIMVANGIRVVAGTHRYASNGQLLSFEDHISDSVNLPQNSVFAALVAPLGLSLHATHHIFPTLPYYALREAHRLLMRESQGEGEPLRFYVAGQQPSMFAAFATIFRLIQEAQPLTSQALAEPAAEPAEAEF